MYNVDFDSSAPVFENHTNFNIDNVVPEKRNNTYGSDAVHRKSMNELLSTSFSEDQQKVLAYALEHSSGGGSGYECLESRVVLTDENVTATESRGLYMAILSYSAQIADDEIIVTFDGTTYTLQKKSMGDVGDYYGDFSEDAPDYTKYPFIVFTSAEGNAVYTETEGAHSIKIEAVQETVETTPCFEKAVSKFIAPLMINIRSVDEEHGTTYLDKKFDEVLNAYLNGRNCILNFYHELIPSLLTGYFLVTRINSDEREVVADKTLKESDDGYLYILGAS